MAPRALVPIRGEGHSFSEGGAQIDVREALAIVARSETLTRQQAEATMATIMAGEATPAQIGALLAALHVRGETVEEIAGFAVALRAVAVPVSAPDDAIDTCGTGGDRSNSFNISTVAAIVATSAGARIAKHGNRAASSRCGSADVLEELGVKIDLGPHAATECLREVGMAFLFAPKYHPAMRHAAPVRREIGIRTVFNLLGPLANPAGVRRQLLGVPASALGHTMSEALRELGAERALVVHGSGGLDEFSPSGPTMLWELQGGTIRESTIDPPAVGLPIGVLDEIRGGDVAVNADMARAVLVGRRGGARTAVLLTAGAALYVAGVATLIRDGVALATKALDSGDAARTLQRLVAASQRLGQAESATP